MFGGSIRKTSARLLLLAAAFGVCLGHAQTESTPAARVISLVGQVSVLKDSAPWALNVGDRVQPRQVVLTGADGFAEFQVADGSRFQVFPNARVVFRQNPASLGQLLDVMIGRVKVFIQKLGHQPNPNNVHTDTAVISVRGTIFDVVVEDDDATTFVSVDEGLVEVANTTAPGGKTRLLNPGESVRVYKNIPLAKSVDKGSVAQGALRAAAQAMYEILLRTSRGGGTTGTGTGTSTASGDKPKPGPPTEAPPAPPPPPPQ